jgi:hypothetical protein
MARGRCDLKNIFAGKFGEKNGGFLLKILLANAKNDHNIGLKNTEI